MANYVSLESLINVDFGKNCRFIQFRKGKLQTTANVPMCHSIELIGYQIQAHLQNICSVNHKGSIIKSVSAFFDILTGYFLFSLPSIHDAHCIGDPMRFSLVVAPKVGGKRKYGFQVMMCSLRNMNTWW